MQVSTNGSVYTEPLYVFFHNIKGLYLLTVKNLAKIIKGHQENEAYSVRVHVKSQPFLLYQQTFQMLITSSHDLQL